MPTEQALRLNTERHVGELKRLGVQYEDFRKSRIELRSKEREYLFSLRQLKAASDYEGRYIAGVDELFDVISGCSRVGKPSWKTPALEHPEFPQALADLHKEGYRVLIDPTLQHPSIKAYAVFLREPKLIGISPSTTWAKFQHELQHKDFDNYIRQHFDRAFVKVHEGKGIREVLPGDIRGRYAERELRELEKYLKAEANEEEVNERLSGMREMRARGLRQYWVSSEGGWDYTDHFMKRFLEQVKAEGQLTPAQRLVLKQINERERGSRQIDFVNRYGLAVLGAGAGALGTYYYLGNDGLLFRARGDQNLIFIQPTGLRSTQD